MEASPSAQTEAAARAGYEAAQAESTPFSLELSNDQRDIRDWVHGFAEQVVRPAAAEDPKVGAFCVSEPDAGSDVSSRRTRARYDETADEWVLNGQKAWATNGGIANVNVIVASVDPELGSRGQAAFLVPPGTKGLEMGAKLKKHGLRASHTADVFLDECRVPGACLLGGKDRLDERLARAREGEAGSRKQAAMRT